jgi:L-fucose isomerase-like protein
MNQHNISSTMVDCDEPSANELIDELYLVKNGIHRLHGQRLGMVGSPSDWLVASVINPFILQTRLGIELVDISWDDIVLDEVKEVAQDFTTLFHSEENSSEVFESGKIYEGLASLIPFYKLNALTVECFPLVRNTGHTACLALSKLSIDGIPAGCEGDTCSAVGLMIANEVCGIIPWMANTVYLKDDKVFFAHCTAPTNLLSKFRLDTHFETDKGLAIAGDIAGDEVTIFRVDNTLNKIFLTKGNIAGRAKAKTACRTQLEIQIPISASDYFVNNPFGNHHLIIPGNWVQRLKLAALLLRMEIVE